MNFKQGFQQKKNVYELLMGVVSERDNQLLLKT